MTRVPRPGSPVPPLALGDPAAARVRLGTGTGARPGGAAVDEQLVRRLRDACGEVDTDPAARAEAGRDWWPLAMVWALDNEVPAQPSCVARPAAAEEVAAVLAICHEAGVPVTPAAGRSGVCGASVPVRGGVALDLTDLSGVVDVDERSATARVRAGTFGLALEEHLRSEHGLTLGHWPQSIELSTVGGWLACRSAGQLSTRYGKIEDLTVGLQAALADGRLLRTGGAPRAAVGPDLTELFLGSEGTLGVICEATLRCRPVPPAQARAAYGFTSFAAGLAACRRTLQRGATPAVLRLHDAAEADRSYGTGDQHVLLVHDEAHEPLLGATMAVVERACGEAGATPLDAGLVDRWFEHRNDVGALEALTRRGYVVDTMEVAAPWSALERVHERTTAALAAVEGCRAATAHQSHAYLDGACLYFTFAGRPEPDEREHFYVRSWDAGQRAALDAGAALSHHHGVGLNRARFVADALGAGSGVLTSLKEALDPRGILNPGKLGLPDPFGPGVWP